MLQNPSKYHPNPLSHFLALHNSHAAHNGNSQPTLSTVNSGHHPFQQEHPLQHPHHGTISSHPTHNQQLKVTHSHLMDPNRSLDAGKSFTIAAILGLQKSAIENNRKDYNVINLSLNNNNNSTTNNNNNNNNQHSTQNYHALMKGEHFLTKHTSSSSNNNNNNNSNNISCAGMQNFNCDTNTTLCSTDGSTSLASRYLPTANVNSSATTFCLATATHQQQSSNASHLRVNSFAAAAAVAAAAAANMTGGAPSALQSLQQLHQHHAQQSNLNFQREKIKTDNHSKKSSLKNKRVRTIFTPEQLERLEAEFERQQYMVGPERLYLAHTLGLTEAQVKVWFQNRRIKWRKHHLEITQQRLAILRQSQMTSTSAEPSNPRITTATPSCDETEDLNNTNTSLREIGESSRQASESDLSICNESNDADSYMDGDET